MIELNLMAKLENESNLEYPNFCMWRGRTFNIKYHLPNQQQSGNTFLPANIDI